VSPKAIAVWEKLSSLEAGVSAFGHDDPDIDCMACLLALTELLEAKGIDCRTFYAGQPTHTQNRVFASKFELGNIASKLKGATKADIAGEDGKRTILFLDTHCKFGKGNMAQAGEHLPDGVDGPHAVIDHHRGKAPDNCDALISSVGSCSTLVYEMGCMAGHRFSKKAMTALLLGIEADTDNLRKEGTTERDRAAAEALKQEADPQLYLSVVNYPKPKALIDVKGHAYTKSNRVEEEGLIISYAGILQLENESLISNVADELINTDNIQTVCVITFVADDDRGLCIRVSCRTSSPVLDIDELMKNTFGADGFGGRNGNGGGRCPLDDQLMLYAATAEQSMEEICRTLFEGFAAKFCTVKGKLS